MLPLPFVTWAIISSLPTNVYSASTQSWFIQEQRASAPPSFVRAGTAPADMVIDMRINLAMGNQDGLEKALEQASTPGSPTFREWLSKEQVEAFATPSADTTEGVNEWLSSYGIPATRMTPAGDWIALQVPVSKASELFNAEFSVYTHIESGQQSVRTLAYSIPANLQGHIRAVYPDTSFTGPMRRAPVIAVSKPELKAESDTTVVSSNCSTDITPACLQALYQIPITPVPSNTASTLAVSAFGGQNANQADLATFLAAFRPDIPADTSFSTTLIDDAMNDQNITNAGLEANLDIQYTVGIATGVPTVFVDVGSNTTDGADSGFLDIINALLADPSPPLVISTSYGFDTEASLSESLSISLCDAYGQLTARGVSIIFATGDGGVASSPGVECDGLPFPPTFPTCPYVTLVGATQNVDPEEAAPLSAGGFSNYFAQQPWQSTAVNAYLALLGTTNAGLFNPSGRAYPDVAAQGNNVQVVIAGAVAGVEGTSCSSPIFAAVVALLNDALLAAGQPPLGFLNPWLYAHPQAFNDIALGSNPGCGTDGFPALPGWDPVTGLGSPNFAALKSAAGL